MMFKNKPGAAPVPVDSSRPKPNRGAVPSIISADMTINGDFHGTGDLQVEGVVTGRIEVNRLIVAEGGSVSGDVVAQDVRICGTLTGSVHSEMVTLTSTARVTGDIYHNILAVEAGGQLDGQSRRLHTGKPVKKPEPAPTMVLEHESAPAE
jgi:cytoskeletal protein CcmA (bactofilin family)